MNTFNAAALAARPASSLAEVVVCEEASRLASLAVAANTKLAYHADWTSFTRWALAAGRDALPATPATVCDYIADRAQNGMKPSSVSRHLSTITARHLAAGYVSPCKTLAVTLVMKGFRKDAAGPTRQAAVLTVETLRAILPRGDDLRSLQARALLLCGFFMAGRRTEIVARTVEDLRLVRGGYLVYVATSKTDQEGKGATAELPRRSDDLCPVTALQAWLAAARITTGPLFRAIYGNAVGMDALHGQQVSRIVKACVAAAGMDASGYSAHSLRRGFATQSAMAGATILEICKAGRWSKGSRAVFGYVEDGEAFQHSAASRF